MVGQLYYWRDAFLAVAHRFERILTLYSEMDIAGEALYYLALTYKDMGADDWARGKLIALTERFPNSPHAASGNKMIASLNQSRSTETIPEASNHENNNKTEIMVSRSGPVSSPSLTPVTSLSRHSK